MYLNIKKIISDLITIIVIKIYNLLRLYDCHILYAFLGYLILVSGLTLELVIHSSKSVDAADGQGVSPSALTISGGLLACSSTSGGISRNNCVNLSIIRFIGNLLKCIIISLVSLQLICFDSPARS